MSVPELLGWFTLACNGLMLWLQTSIVFGVKRLVQVEVTAQVARLRLSVAIVPMGIDPPAAEPPHPEKMRH